MRYLAVSKGRTKKYTNQLGIVLQSISGLRLKPFVRLLANHDLMSQFAFVLEYYTPGSTFRFGVFRFLLMTFLWEVVTSLAFFGKLIFPSTNIFCP
jgi:hypothetical protein